MKIIGLTGGSGAGKGEISRIFRDILNVPVLDTDEVAFEVTNSDECKRELAEYFGVEIILTDGGIDRAKLAVLAFSSKEAHTMLNRITHKYILNRCIDWFAEMKHAGHTYTVLDAPLLYEAGAEKFCDAVVAVIANTELRIARIMKRDEIGRHSAISRIKCQNSDDFFRRRASYVIENNGDVNELECVVINMFNEIKNETGKNNL